MADPLVITVLSKGRDAPALCCNEVGGLYNECSVKLHSTDCFEYCSILRVNIFNVVCEIVTSAVQCLQCT
jgi:hypothetical protein